MRSTFVFWVTLLVFWSASSIQAQDARFTPIRERMQKFVTDGDIAGSVVVVGNSKGVLYLDAIGWQNLEASSRMRKDTIFRIASMTKPITAIGIMILVDEKKLAVDDPVEKHLPEFRGQVLAFKEEGKVKLKKPGRPITIRDLLTHTSGLPGSYAGDFKDLYIKRNHSLAAATSWVAKQPLEFEPGTKWAYCNTGIDTLGRIIEMVSGQSYETFLKERIFRPLGMKETTFYPSQIQLDRTAAVYDRQDRRLVPSVNLIIDITSDAKHPVPAGGLFSTAEDLSRLYQLMLNRGVYGSLRLLSDESTTAMTRTQTGDINTGFVPGMSFGFGWAVVKEPQGITGMLSPGSYGHGGAYGTQVWIDPSKDLFMVLLIQRTGLPNADASPMRSEFQRLAVQAIKEVASIEPVVLACIPLHKLLAPNNLRHLLRSFGHRHTRFRMHPK
jgi:CubicO group peptidase (beta-lactamase class C family)